MKKWDVVLTMVLSGCLSGTAVAQAQTSLHLVNTFRIASAGGWDYLATSPIKNWLYISHGNQVNIVDKKSGDSVGVIANTTGVHGIAFDVLGKKGFTSNGRLNTVTIFDLTTNEILGQVAVGQNPDAIFYEPFSKKIITCNGRSNNLSIIDPATGLLIDSLALGGKPETAVSDGAGKMYINIEDKNEIAVVDTKTFRLLVRWKLAPGEGPTGLAIDPVTKRLFVGCEKLLMVMDAEQGKIIDQLPIGDGCDGVAFDPSLNNIYTSNGEGTLTVIHETNANKFSVLKNILTKKGARTIALDNGTHTVYLPTAEFEPMEKGQQGRPKVKAGTFQVLVLEN